MKEKKVLKSFVMISQIGISLMGPILLCGALGYWLNNLFHKEILFVILIVLGIGAAFRNVYVLTRGFYADDLKKEMDAAAYIEHLKSYHQEHPEEDFSDVMDGKKKRYPENKGPTRH